MDPFAEAQLPRNVLFRPTPRIHRWTPPPLSPLPDDRRSIVCDPEGLGGTPYTLSRPTTADASEVEELPPPPPNPGACRASSAAVSSLLST